jgi:hypothetical protein
MGLGDQLIPLGREASLLRNDQLLTRIVRHTAVLLVSVVFSVCAAHRQASEITLDDVIVSNSLSGNVTIGVENIPASNITVELCGKDWKSVIASTSTDRAGHFSFEKRTGSLFYIRFTAPGVTTYRLKVRLDRTAKESLMIRLSNAT